MRCGKRSAEHCGRKWFRPSEQKERCDRADPEKRDIQHAQREVSAFVIGTLKFGVLNVATGNWGRDRAVVRSLLDESAWLFRDRDTIQVLTLQHLGPALAQIGQFRFISSVNFPRTLVIVPVQPSQECFVPTRSTYPGSLGPKSLGRYSFTAVTLQCGHAIASVSAGFAAGTAAVAFAFAAFSARICSICAQYCGPGPAKTDVLRLIARARTDPSPMVLMTYGFFMVVNL